MSAENQVKTSQIPTLGASVGKTSTSPVKTHSQRTPSVGRSMVRPESERLLELEYRDKQRLENQLNMYFEELKSLRSHNSALALQLEYDKNNTDYLARQYETRLEVYKTTAMEREELYEALQAENDANMEAAGQYYQLSEQLQQKLDALDQQLAQFENELHLKGLELEQKVFQNEELQAVVALKQTQQTELEEKIKRLDQQSAQQKEEITVMRHDNEEKRLLAIYKRRDTKKQGIALICIFALACGAGIAALL